MRFPAKLFCTLCTISVASNLFAQDKIFKTDGDTIYGKVVEVWETQIKFLKQDNLKGPYYVVKSSNIDSIVYENGKTDEIARLFHLRRESNHLKTKNTYSFDLLGPVHYSVTQWYERRVWKNRIGLRIPLYLCFSRNYSPGFRGIRVGRQYPYTNPGFAFATGINPKFYFNKHKIVRVFAGPELDIGFTNENDGISLDSYQTYYRRGMGNVELAGMAGININPIAAFNVTLEGGAGYTYAFDKNSGQGNPVWRIGLSFGGNF